jgi:hypothetical protein
MERIKRASKLLEKHYDKLECCVVLSSMRCLFTLNLAASEVS